MLPNFPHSFPFSRPVLDASKLTTLLRTAPSYLENLVRKYKSRGANTKTLFLTPSSVIVLLLSEKNKRKNPRTPPPSAPNKWNSYASCPSSAPPIFTVPYVSPFLSCIIVNLDVTQLHFRFYVFVKPTDLTFPAVLWSCGRPTSNRNEYQGSSLGVKAAGT